MLTSDGASPLLIAGHRLLAVISKSSQNILIYCYHFWLPGWRYFRQGFCPGRPGVAPPLMLTLDNSMWFSSKGWCNLN